MLFRLANVAKIISLRAACVSMVLTKPKKKKKTLLSVTFFVQNQLLQAQRNQDLIEEEEYYESVSAIFITSLVENVLFVCVIFSGLLLERLCKGVFEIRIYYQIP